MNFKKELSPSEPLLYSTRLLILRHVLEKSVTTKTFWKIETANAIFWMYLGGTFRFCLKLKFVKPHKISTHLAYSDNFYFHLFYRLSD